MGSRTRLPVRVSLLVATALISVQHSEAFGTGNVEFENDGTMELETSGLTVPNNIGVP